MTLTEKYNFNIKINQHHTVVDNKWQDQTEYQLLEAFESCCLYLKRQNNKTYSMIEMGSNWAYYSLLFKHILKDLTTINILCEPSYMIAVGEYHFQINGVEGHFYKGGVGNKMELHGFDIEINNYRLQQLMEFHNLERVDILHCDIDFAEMILLEENEDFFKKGLSKFIFMLTHSDNITQQCKTFFESTNYKLLIDYPFPTIGGDGLLIYKYND